MESSSKTTNKNISKQFTLQKVKKMPPKLHNHYNVNVIIRLIRLSANVQSIKTLRHQKQITMQRRNRGEIYGATSAMVGQNLPPLVGIGLRHLKI